MLNQSLIAQQIQVFQKKIIRDSLENLIINPEIPVFLHIADNPEGKNSVNLIPEEPDGVPLIFQNSGKHSFTQFNSTLNKKIPFNFIVDGIPPVTGWYSESLVYIHNDTIYGSKNFEIHFDSNDKLSGVKNIYHAINGQEYEIYKDMLILDDEGFYEIKFFAVDNVENAEEPQTINVVIDITAPETNLSIIGDRHKNILSPRSKISLEAFDRTRVKQILYSINDNEPEVYSEKITLNNLPEGYHTLQYYSIDKTGNKETKQNFEFFIDKTPPIIIEDIIGNSFVSGGKVYSSGRSQLRITAVDNKAGVKEIYYSINDGEYILYERPVFLTEYSGEINIKTYALDKVNNESVKRFFQPDGANIPYIDLNAPDIRYQIIGPAIFLRDTLFISDKSAIKLHAEDRESGVNRIVYRVDQNKEQVYDKPFSMNQPGYHQISYTAYDNVENANNDSFNFFVDLKGPHINHNFSMRPRRRVLENGKEYKAFHSHVKLYLSATDEKTGTEQIFYTANEQKEQVYSNPVNGFETGKINNIAIRAVDILGNESFKEISFYISE